ncbi:MAG TPA: peptidylprolyl isomerase [Chryseosolibacter sp.]
MAFIGTLRNKAGTWVVIFVFVAIISFILQDLLGNNSVLLNNDDVGEIAGKDISLAEYQAAIQEREANYILNFNRKPGDREMLNLRQQAWELLVLRNAFQKQFDEVGVDVTTEEVEDMIWGKNVDDNIRQTQAFVNQQTGQFDKNLVIQYLNSIKDVPSDPQQAAMWQEQRTRWELFQRDLAPGRERIKYENLLIKTNYITTAEAEKEYHNQTDVAEAKYIYIPFYSVSDSVEVPDSDLKAYYDSHKERFKTEEVRDLKYVEFAITASAADSAAIREDMQRMVTELSQTDDDSAFAASNTDGAEAFGKYNAGNVPTFVKVEDLKKGNIIGPVLDGGAYKVAKVSDVVKDTVYSARAAHILIKWENETAEGKKAANEKARGILNEIRKGASFAAKALEHGTDGTATKGGDLGWFQEGIMVKTFNDAVFNATKTGLLNDVVETDFGYHIISITNTKDNTGYKVAVIERVIGPSDATTNEVYRKAEAFQNGLSNLEEFQARAKEVGVIVQDAKGIPAGERRVGNLGDARQVVQWLYRDASEGEVSDVFDLQQEYVVAIMTDKTEKGYRSLESVKNEILPEVKKQVKAKTIIAKLKDLKGTLEEVANAYGNDAGVYTTADLKMNATSLQGAGFDPKAVGVAFALENGKRSEPFAGENGVLIMEVQNKTVAPEIADYTQYEAPLQQNVQTRASFNIAEAIKEHAKIEDKRYKFY